MATTHGLHPHPLRRSRTGSRIAQQEREAAPEREVLIEREPTALGGRVLNVATVIAAVAWVVAMWQLLRLPVEGVGITTMETALWTALGISAGIGTFLLGVWRVHRA